MLFWVHSSRTFYM